MSPKKEMKVRFRRMFPRVRNILWEEWNPIGWPRDEMPDDEYDNYIPQIIGHIERGSSSEELAEYLLQIETDRMGIKSTSEKEALEGLTVVAEKLMSLRESR